MTAQKKKILVVDDSSVMRRILRDIISRQDDMECIAEACDALEAREAVKRYNPDVMTLDVEMPHMDGLTFLEKVMQLRPMPVVMASTLTHKGTEHCIRALEIGAAACVGKPDAEKEKGGFGRFAEELVLAVREASAIDPAALCRMAERAARRASEAASAKKVAPISVASRENAARQLLAIGASTGGVEALSAILPRLPGNLPPVVVTQHMPPGFTSMFAKRLNSLCALEVKEASHHEKLVPGTVYIAPGANQFTVKRNGKGELCCAIGGNEKISGHCPSVDYLFSGVAEAVGAKAVGVILTGMGVDGAAGLLKMRSAGANTFGQSAATCVVYGMPKAAMENGAVCRQASLGEMPATLAKACEE
ncbi:MAG: chemotaxis response regulator protein-glutamate methylesterase [Rickettsiales bacterium]